MKLRNKNILIVIAIVLPMGFALAWAVHRLFFLNEDADEGDSKFWNLIRFWKQEPVKYTPNSMVNYKIKDITSSLPKHKTKKYPTRNLSQIEQVVIHHSATKSTAIGSKPEVYAKFHVENRGWAGIGYHFVIQPDGSIFQTQHLNTVSNHVQNANTKSIGICLSGNFDEEQPTQQAYGAAVWLVQSLSAQLGRILEIKGHNEYAPKSCPGAAINISHFKELVNI